MYPLYWIFYSSKVGWLIGKKCNFAKASVEYLVDIISREEVAMDPTKVLSVLRWPTPMNVK